MNTSLPDLRDAADVLVSNGLVQDIALDEPFEPPPSQDEVCRTLVGHEGRNRAGEAAGGGWEDYEQEGEESEDDKVDSVGAEISSTEESEDEDESWSESGSGSESASEDEEHEDNGNGELGNREKPNSDTVLDMRQGAKRFGKRVRVEPKVGDPWYPFGSKGIQMAEMAFNSPRAKYSRMQQSGALSMVQELSGELVAPSLDALGKARKRMEAITGKSTHRETTSSGVVWYRNEISSSLANDMSNPITRCDMEFYPHLECNGQRMTQVWHGAKMLYDMPDHLLTPMMRASSNGTIYYVDELVKLSDGRFFIPRRWFLKGDSKARWCFGDIVTETAAGLIIERTSRALRTSVPVESISHAYSELLVSPDLFPGFAPGFEVDLELMPHPLRIVAGERDVYSVPLILFLDDVSGGVSKQWNKNIACYMSNATLPREQLQKEVNVCFVGSSKEATASELLLGISNSIKQEFLNPTVAFDALTMREALIRPYALMWPGDNPMQAEECSCGGLGSNFNCRTCGAGGTQEFKRTTEGYSSLFEEGTIRDPRNTLEIINARMEMALQASSRGKVDSHATQTGVKDGISQPIVERLLALGVKLRTVVPGLPPMSPDKVQEILLEHLVKAKEQGAVNALLDMDGTDIHQDTPTEILHTVLLGVVKYFWAQTIHIVKQQHQMDLFRARLCSVDSAGLAIPPLAADYMCDYSGSLIGKHFKAIAQVMPFVIYDLVPQNVRDAWLLIGRLVVLLWDVEISNLDSYLAELKDVIDKFMLTTAACSPSIILLKPKFHFLVHLPRFIARFGPAILYSTERYESYHAVFRGTMIKSNRQAPSRDAAKAIASIRRVQHICRGGYWRNPDGSGWVQASPDVLQFVKRSTVFTKLLGIYVKPVPKPGTVVFIARPRKRLAEGEMRKPLTTSWVDTTTAKSGLMAMEPGNTQREACYQPLKSVVALSGDPITPGMYAIIKIERSTHFCKVVELLLRRSDNTPTAKSVYFATVQPMQLSETKQLVLNMPKLTLMPCIRLVEFLDIVCAVNLQHNCIDSGCFETRSESILKEREITSYQHKRVNHLDTSHFLVNTQSLHNSNHISNALPLALRGLLFLINDRADRLSAAALILRVDYDTKAAKRKAAASKAKEDKAAEAAKVVLAASQTTARANEPPRCSSMAPPNVIVTPIASGSGSARPASAFSRAIPALPQLLHCTIPVLKTVCRLFNMTIGTTTRKADFISRLESHFAESNQTAPTEDALKLMKEETKVNKKRNIGALELEPDGATIAGPSRRFTENTE